MEKKTLTELQQEVRLLKSEIALRDGELPFGLSVFYRGSLVLGQSLLIGAGVFSTLIAFVAAAMFVALVPIGALKAIAGVIIFSGTWTWALLGLLKCSARWTVKGLRRVLEEKSPARCVGALAAGGASTPVPVQLNETSSTVPPPPEPSLPAFQHGYES